MAKAVSAGCDLLATVRPLRGVVARAIVLAEADCTLALRGSWTTCDCESDAAHDASRPRTRDIAHRPKHTSHKTPRPSRSPRTDQMYRPPHLAPCRSGWTRAHESGILTATRTGLSARHEGSGAGYTRAFIFSEEAIYRVNTAVCDDDEWNRSFDGEFVRLKRVGVIVDSCCRSLPSA